MFICSAGWIIDAKLSTHDLSTKCTA